LDITGHTSNEAEATEISPVASSNIMEIASFDGYTLRGRLTLPSDESIGTLVIKVNSSGPHTFDTRRNFGAGVVNHNDFYALRFQEQGIAFFSYNTRGVDHGDTPPLFITINDEQYLTYLPSNQVQDIYYMINAIRKSDPRLANSRILLWGHSEGAIIAPLFAKQFPHMVDGLILLGAPIVNLRNVLIWQNTGGPSMVWYRAHFEADEQGRISKEAFEADPNNVIASVLQNTAFDDIDRNNDGYLCEEDFAIIWPSIVGHTLDEILSAIERRDNTWLMNNYPVRLTAEWFLEHFELRSNMELLPTLDLPIFIFHGTLDQNVCVREVYALRDKLSEFNRTNITIKTFAGHDHELNLAQYITHAIVSEGMQAALDAAINF